jgi:hypothetical protein
MMKEFAQGRRPRMSRVAKIAAAILACIAVAGAAVAATGGLERIINYTYNFTGTVEFEDGTEIYVEDGKLLDDEGNVIGTVEVELNTDPESPELLEQP